MTNVRNRVYCLFRNFYEEQFYSLVYAFECMIQAFGTFDSVFKFKYSRIRIHEEENDENYSDKQTFDFLIDLVELNKPFDVSKMY